MKKSALNQLKFSCAEQVSQLKNAYFAKKIRCWLDVEKYLEQTIPLVFTQKTFDYSNLTLFLQYWVTSLEARTKAEMEHKIEKLTKVESSCCQQYGNITLKEEQQPCVDEIVKRFLSGELSLLQDGYTGQGKTFVAGAVISELISKDKSLLTDPLCLCPVLILTPKNVVTTWRRVLYSMGLQSYLESGKIQIKPDTIFTTKSGQIFCQEKDDFTTGETLLKWNLPMIPKLIILDECHRLVNDSAYRHKVLSSLFAESRRPKALFLSATPGEKINDFKLFVTSTERTFLNINVDQVNWPIFAGLLDKRPDKPNREALKRLRSVISSNIISMPYVKPPHKAINQVWLVDFANEKDKEIYQMAHNRYLDARAQMGKDSSNGLFDAFVALNVYRRTVEPLRAKPIVQKILDNQGKFATGVGCAFKDTILAIAFELVYKHNIPRDKISIVWGGKTYFNPKDIIPKDELLKLCKSLTADMLEDDPSLHRRIKLSMQYLEDQTMHAESSDEQRLRHEKIRELRLAGTQSENTRQIEVDNFQDGTSEILLFTLAAGGIGLSFDKDKPHLLPREAIFTPIYSGKEFQQALGRFVRRASLADCNQHICMMRNTVEHSHVAPILDEKLGSIAAITNRSFNMINLLDNKPAEISTELRSIEKVLQDADDSDNILVSDIHDETEETDLTSLLTL